MSALLSIVPQLLGFLKNGLSGGLGWAEGAAKDNPKSALGLAAVGGSFLDPTYWQKTFEFIAAVAKAVAPLVK